MLNQLENKRKMVMDFISKGEKLMEDPNCPKFLEGHVKKLREAWDDTQEKAQVILASHWSILLILISHWSDPEEGARGQHELLGDI